MLLTPLKFELALLEKNQLAYLKNSQTPTVKKVYKVLNKKYILSDLGLSYMTINFGLKDFHSRL